MKKLLGILILSLTLLGPAACSGPTDALTEEIRDIAADPELQSEEGLQRLTDIILSDKATYRGYILPDGEINMEKLAATVEKTGRQADPNFSWDIRAYGGILSSDLKLNLFLERSGSMQGYDTRSGSGNFKATLTELVNRFPLVDGSTGRILIVNDAIYPWEGDFKRFLQERDIFSATAGIGDASFTDFARIFEYVLTDSVTENVNVLVTDMIYSPRGAEGVSAPKILAEERSIASSLFRDHADKSVIIVKMSSDFNGAYYPYSSPSAGVKYSGQRPYYIIVTGSAAAMHRLRTDSRYASWRDFSSLPGYQADYFFNRRPLTLPYYTLLPRNRASKGSFTLSADDNGSDTRAMKDVRGDASGNLTFQIAADLSRIPAADAYLTDTRNYTLSGADAKLMSVKKITTADIDPRNKRFLEKATHLFTVSVDTHHPSSELKISLANRLPDWVKKSHSTDDRNVAGARFATTTFGIADFMEGIFEAYHGTALQPEFFSMRILFKN